MVVVATLRSARNLIIGSILAVLLGCGMVSAPPASAAPSFEARTASALLAVINHQRWVAHLPPLRRNADLDASAAHHSHVMARFNTMTHQMRGEADLGARLSTAGYRWRAGAENVGWNSDVSLYGIMVLNNIMVHEAPGQDGHRRNLYNPYTRDIGINVFVDAVHHKVWLTEDFGTPA